MKRAFGVGLAVVVTCGVFCLGRGAASAESGGEADRP